MKNSKIQLDFYLTSHVLSHKYFHEHFLNKRHIQRQKEQKRDFDLENFRPMLRWNPTSRAVKRQPDDQVLMEEFAEYW